VCRAQELCTGLGITELESTADFPYDMETFRNVLVRHALKISPTQLV